MAKTMPTRRARKRWVHSHQKMYLKAARLMPRLTWRYCGIWRYFSKASCQAASESGGTMPMMGCHSVMESPDPVRRVAPPILTIANTRAATANNHTRTGLSRAVAEGLRVNTC